MVVVVVCGMVEWLWVCEWRCWAIDTWGLGYAYLSVG